MKIRTPEQLSDFLSSEIAWRKKELTALRSLVESAKSTGKRKTFIRGGIALLYANWEGFVKQAASGYLEFVAMQRLQYADVTANFIALAVKAKLEAARQTNKAAVFNEVAEFFLTGLSGRCQFPYKGVIKTKANLSSEVFRDIVCILNLDYSLYETKEKFIDQKLLKQRNRIAHGKYLLVDCDEYLEVHREVISLLNLFRNQIDNAVLMQAYLRSE
jgi:hypothetical protein